MKSIASVAIVVLISLSTFAAQDEALKLAQARTEDVRRLHRAAIAEIQDVRTLARYLKDWGGPDRDPEADTLMVEAEGLYGIVRAADHASQGLQALRDATNYEARRTAREAAKAAGGDADAIAAAETTAGADIPTTDSEYLSLLDAARRYAAIEVTSLYGRAGALKTILIGEVRAKAREARPFEIVSEAMPWVDDPIREANRNAGLQYGWSMDEEFFAMSPSDQDAMAAKAASIGARFVEVDWSAACDWGEMEPEPGVYDFSGLDHAVALLSEHGLHIVPRLRTFTGKPPEWFLEGHKNKCRLEVPNRERDGSISIKPTGINLLDPTTNDAFIKFLTAYAEHLRSIADGLVDAISIDNRVETEAVPDISPAMNEAWQAVGNNGVWTPPEEIPLDTPENATAHISAESFREYVLTYSLAMMRDALKKGWPEVNVQIPVASDDFHRMIDGHTGLSRDFAQISMLADVASTATDSPAGFALLHSLAFGRTVWSHMIHSGCGMCGSTAASHVPFYDTVHIVHGNQGRSTRSHFPDSWFRYQDHQLGDSGIGNHWIAPLRMAQIAPTILNTRPVYADVAVYWSQGSLRRDRKSTYKSAMAWGHLLQRIQVPYDYVANDRLGDLLRHHKVLILPNCQSMSDSECDTIRDWVRAGGILLAFGVPGRFASDGTERDALPLADVFGADIATMCQPGPVTPDKLDTTHPEGCFQGGNLPPRPYKFETNLAAVLAPRDDVEARAWYDGAHREPAIVEHRFGDGEALFCGFPLGFEYWESAPYELALGMTHHRNPNHNAEQKRYEAWVLAELSRRGIVRPAVLSSGRYLRAQRGDDPDWYHVYRNGPNYQEYMFEDETPVRASYAFPRCRDGIDATYVGIANTEINYMWERGYFISTLAGAYITADVAVSTTPAADAGLVVDARLGVPVPFQVLTGHGPAESAPAEPTRLRFTAWIPAAQSAAFAVTASSSIRLFGEGAQAGDTPETVRERVMADIKNGAPLSEGVTLVHEDELKSAIAALGEKDSVLIGCGDRRFLPAAKRLATRLGEELGIESQITMAGARVRNCRDDYMDGYGWTDYGAAPVRADILIGNAQDNGLMFDFLTLKGDCRWLPLEINQDFPGPGRAIVALPLPCTSRSSGRTNARLDGYRPIVLGASHPADAISAVAALPLK